MAVAYAKVQGNVACRKITRSKGKRADLSRNSKESGDPSEDSEFSSGDCCIQMLASEKARIAENARRAALDILKDALGKGMYGKPVRFHRTCAEMQDPYKFCAILTKEFLENTIEKMERVRFRADASEDMAGVFAYVYPTDASCTVYLGPAFWGAPSTLEENSQPGTLIHEVSHFLGTEDQPYELLYIEGDIFQGSVAGKRVAGKDYETEEYDENSLMTINANSVAYEFETVINHEGKWDQTNGKYSCCGETKQHSVCCNRATGHYHLHELVGAI